MYSVERAMLDNWAAWMRRNKYLGGPRKLRNPLGAVMELGIPIGPVHYSDEVVDTDQEAEAVDRFMLRLKLADERVYAALMARHAREFTDSRGVRWVNSQLPERKIAAAMYGTSHEAARKMLYRLCDDGYKMLCNYREVA